MGSMNGTWGLSRGLYTDATTKVVTELVNIVK
jgi:hypothetical protein